jgi:hypothetical protein
MKRVLGAVLVGALIFAADTASAQLKNSGTSRIRGAGTLHDRPVRSVLHLQRRLGAVSPLQTAELVINRKLGKMRINNLTRLGAAPIPPSLDGRVVGTIFYGQDENAVCPLANTV